jgi:hypothetical protein
MLSPIMMLSARDFIAGACCAMPPPDTPCHREFTMRHADADFSPLLR